MQVNKEPMHREVTIDQRKPSWIDKWVNPTTVLALLGGIIWGIQLNIAVINHTEQIAATAQRVDQVIAVDAKQNEQITRVSIILDNITTKLEDINEKYNDHEKEAGIWKRQIQTNTTKLDHLHEDKHR